ncbi:hypothetical protein ASZ78_016589 [Callipepla squamata]|uniref:Uncharacterized protein n=1 Tax=Callipepla squamata TaxID=9009 RepID=A0A226MFE2_CALSU|nr:hypothetical protein ASZ78_016589 [Callipepla squamata]
MLLFWLLKCLRMTHWERVREECPFLSKALSLMVKFIGGVGCPGGCHVWVFNDAQPKGWGKGECVAYLIVEETEAEWKSGPTSLLAFNRTFRDPTRSQHDANISGSSTNDLPGHEHGCMRRSPDQYGSQGSMESLDHSSPAYQPRHLSPAKSSNSIDQLCHVHSKRDSAYSSFSTNPSIPECTASPFSKEHSSADRVHSRGSQLEGMRQADIRYVQTVYDAQRRISEEYEVKSSALLPSSEGQASLDGRDHGRLHNSSWNDTAPSWVQPGQGCSDSESKPDEGPPLPPTRSDSYAAIRHHERPRSCSDLDLNKPSGSQLKGSCSTLVSPLSQGPLLKTHSGEGQLHTVVEKSPESSPTVKPKQSYSQAGKPLLPTGVYPVPSPEPHYALVPQPSASNNGTLFPALAKESGYSPSLSVSYDKGAASSTLGFEENGNQSTTNGSDIIYEPSDAEKEHDGTAELVQQKTPNTAG